MAGVKLPGTTERYLFDEFDHIDFQAQDKFSFTDERCPSDLQFKPQEEFDETNTFFGQSKFAHKKIQNCPLATLSMS